MSSLILRLERLAALSGDTPTSPTGIPSPAVGEPAVIPSAEGEPTVREPAAAGVTAVPEPADVGPLKNQPASDSIFLPEVQADPVTAPDPASVPAQAAAPDRVVDLTTPERESPYLSLNRWSAAVAASNDACFVLDHHGVVLSVSAPAVDLLGVGNGMIIGRHVLEAVTLVDLESGTPHPDYAPRITALVVLEGPGLARSIMRVRRQDRSITTLDSSSAPIHDPAGELLGSVTFLGRIPA